MTILRQNPLESFNNRFCQVVGKLELRVNDYDAFAPVYDRIMGFDYAELITPSYSHVIETHFPECKINHLDLACGSGAFGRLIVNAFNPRLSSYGIDMSIGQIASAKQKARDSGVLLDYNVGNVLTCEFPAQMQVVTMNLDALNHLRSLEQWSSLFRKVYSALECGGTFLFDINTQRRILHDWNTAEIIIKPDMTYVQIGSGVVRENDVVRRRLYMEVFTREPAGAYAVVVEQIAPTTDKLYQMLFDAGFSDVKETAFLRDERMSHIFMKNRLHLIAKRKN